MHVTAKAILAQGFLFGNSMEPYAAVAATPDVAVASSRPLASFLSNLHSSPQVVGAAWLVSSAVFTTYSTTKFLQFSYDDPESLRRKMERTALPFQHRYVKRFLSLPPPSMLTLWRFLGSLLLGLLLHPDFEIPARVKQTWDLIPNVALPAAFLFVANLANSCVGAFRSVIV